MPKPVGLFLVNITQWGVHDPNSLLAPLNGVRMWLNDAIIEKAKTLAAELEMSEFAIVRVTREQARVQLYAHKFDEHDELDLHDLEDLIELSTKVD